MIKEIKDPELPGTLEDLNIIDEERILVCKKGNYTIVTIIWKPTTPYCSFALNIGLCIRYKIKQELDYKKIKIDIILQDGSHKQKEESN